MSYDDLILLVAYFAFVGIFLLWSTLKTRYIKAKNRFYKELDKRMDLGVVKKLEDITLIQQSAAEEIGSARLASQDLTSLLSTYLSKITEKGKLKTKEKKQRFQSIRLLIDEARKKKPFSGLPEKEQELAISLKDSIEAGNKQLSIKKLEELATSLGVELQSAREEINRNRRWTILSALGGLGGIVLILLLYLLA